MRHSAASHYWGNRYGREIQILQAKILVVSYETSIAGVGLDPFHENESFEVK